ncbi:MAG: SDR family oxidoreductase [Hyphomonadaceae bacterium]|nr:SDR family oxidoreductase [Hyphomonadaceae bacterium]
MGVLSNKVALVTGAGQGVGRGIALAMAKAGAAVCVSGRTEAKLHTVCGEIEAAGGKAAPIPCDVSDLAAIKRAVEQSAQAFGGLDILVNNAYDGAWGPLLSLSDEAFQKGFINGPFATFRFMIAAHPHLKARGGGAIINLATSAEVRWDMSNYGAYGAAKSSVRVLTRAAAAEWGVDNIRVNTVCPLANSPALDAWTKHNAAEAEAFFATIPLRRIGDCEADIGEAAVFLASDSARYLTGATIPLDGGQARFG